MYLSKAFRSVNLYEDSSEPVINHCEGRTQLKNFFKNESNKESPLEFSDNNVYIDQQPLYCEEVDHQIEEVGIMAVKEVRYVTEREWEKMVEQQTDQKKIWEYLENRYKAESKQRMVSQRKRNSKGQFLKGEKEGRKKKGIGKRGRPKKVEQRWAEGGGRPKKLE